MSDFTIYTVCTGHFKYGLFALIKSLRKKGYDGKIIVGVDNAIREIEHLQGVEQVRMVSEYSFGNLKSKLILENPSEYFLYLDSDIILMNPRFLDMVAEQLRTHKKQIHCVEGIMVRNEVRRVNWNRLNNVSTLPIHDFYYNAGCFAGCFSKHSKFLENWNERIHALLAPGNYLYHHPDFPMADQDVLNSILQNKPQDDMICIGMPDWLGTATLVNPFIPVGTVQEPYFVHATGKQKPWLVSKWPRRYPNLYDRLFFQYHQDDFLDIKADLHFGSIIRYWFKGGRLLPFINKINTLIS